MTWKYPTRHGKVIEESFRHQDVAGRELMDTLQSNPTILQASALPSGCRTVSADGTPSTAGVPGTVVLGSGWLLMPET